MPMPPAILAAFLVVICVLLGGATVGIMLAMGVI